MNFKPFLFLGAAFLLTAANCSEEATLPSHVGNISSAVVAPCSPDGKKASCLFLTNPLESKTVIYNFNAKQFVMGPLGTGPLVIANGPLTSKLAYISEAKSRFFGLDIQSGEIISHKASGSNAFSDHSRSAVQLDGYPTSLNLLPGTDDDLFAVVRDASKERAGIRIQKINPMTGEASGALSEIQIFSVGEKEQSVKEFFASETVPVAGITFKDLSGVYFSSHADVLAGNRNLVKYESATQMSVKEVYLSPREFNGDGGPFALILGQDQDRIELISLADANKPRLVAWFELGALPEVGYLPSLKTQACCNGLTDWIQVIDTKGNLNYLTLQKPKDSSVNDDSTQMYLAKSVKLEKVFSTASLAYRPIGIFPAKISIEDDDGKQSLARKTVYCFETGLVGMSEEGVEDFTRIQPPL